MWLLVGSWLLAILLVNGVMMTTDHHNTSATDSKDTLIRAESQENETTTSSDRILIQMPSNLTDMFNGTLNETVECTDALNKTEVHHQNGTETAHNYVFGSLSSLKQLISKTYWEQRMRDPYYLSEALIPFCAGILVSWLLILVFCTLRCCCSKKNRRNKLMKIRTIKNDPKKKDGSQWMLLEKNSSDEEI